MADTFENDMKKAFPNAPVPAALQQRFLARENAVRIGRRAEEMLHAQGGAKPGGEMLLAQAAVGRLALLTDLPPGSDPETLAEEIARLPAVQQLAKKEPAAQLEGLKGRNLFRLLAPEEKKREPAENAAPVLAGKKRGPAEKGIL